MTVATTTSKVIANGNGVATVFSFSPFTVFADTELEIRFVSTLGVETVLVEGTGTTNYSVSLSTPNDLPSTGSITYPATLGTILQNGEKLVLKRVEPLLQNTDLGNQGGYFPEVQEAQFDRGIMIDIQQQEQIDRSIKIPTSNTTVTSTELPNPVAGQVLGWNGSATAIINITPTISADISNALIVVSGSQPALVNGRIWIDTSSAGNLIVRICDGVDYNQELTRVSTATNILTFTNKTQFLNPTSIVTALITATETKQVNDNGASGVYEYNLHNSASPAVNDVIWQAQFDANNTAPALLTYAKNKIIITDATPASEDAKETFQTIVAGTLADRLNIGAGIFTPSVTDKGADTINALGYYTNGTLNAASDVSIQAGATHAPSLSDHGKTFIYTAAGGCAVTIPAAAGLFAGWKINQLVATGAGVVTNNRSSTDTLWSKNTSLTALKLPSPGDGGSLVLDSTGGTAKFYWVGKRSFTSTDTASTVSTTTVIPHTLSVVPDNYNTVLVNTIANLGYSPGDVVEPDGTFINAGGGFSAKVDATNITIITVNGGTALPNTGTFVGTAITTADWNIRTSAMVIN